MSRFVRDVQRSELASISLFAVIQLSKERDRQLNETCRHALTFP